MPSGWCFILAPPFPGAPWWADVPAWSRRDPMTAAELEASLDWTCEHGEHPREEEYEDFPELTPGELAEIREAAADELLAVGAATTGRRGAGQPGAARVPPRQASRPAAAVAPGVVP